MAGGIIPPLEIVGSWPTPNYMHPTDEGWGLTITVIILTLLSLAFVCARLWARYTLRSWGIDDWIIVAAMVPAIAMSVLICLASRLFGFNHHIWDNTIGTSINSRKVVMAIEATYLLSTGLVKVSILLFYRRLVAGTFSRFFVWAVRLVIFSVAAYMITFELTLIFGCRPMHAYWDEVNPVWRGLNSYSCLDEVATLFAANITSIIQDFLTFLLPLLLFTKLQLPIRQKIILGAIFSIGFFLCIVGIIRIIYTRHLYYATYDVTWESEPLWYWTATELHGAIMCASAPACKVFFKRYLRSSKNGSKNSGPSDRPSNGYSGPRRPHDAEKGKVLEYSGTDTTFSQNSSRMGGTSTVSTFVGAGSGDYYEPTAWTDKGVEGWNDLNEHFGGVSVGRTVETFSTPTAIAIPLRKPGSGTLVNMPSRGELSPLQESPPLQEGGGSWLRV